MAIQNLKSPRELSGIIKECQAEEVLLLILDSPRTQSCSKITAAAEAEEPEAAPAAEVPAEAPVEVPADAPAQESEFVSSQVISVQLKGQLLFGPPKSLPGPAPSL